MLLLLRAAESVRAGRGIEGESVLHICKLLGTDAHAKVAHYLLAKFGAELTEENGRRYATSSYARVRTALRCLVEYRATSVSIEYRCEICAAATSVSTVGSLWASRVRFVDASYTGSLYRGEVRDWPQ